MCALSCFSRVWLYATPWTIARQAPLSMGFSRHQHLCGCLVLSRGVFPTQGSNLCLLSPTGGTWEAPVPGSVWLCLDPNSHTCGHVGTSHRCLWKHLFCCQPEVEVLMRVMRSWTLQLEDGWLPRLPVCPSLADGQGLLVCLQLLPFRGICWLSCSILPSQDWLK